MKPWADKTAIDVAAVNAWWEAAIADITQNYGGPKNAEQILPRVALTWMASEPVPTYRPGEYFTVMHTGRSGTLWEDRHQEEYGAALAASSVAEKRKIQTEAIAWVVVGPQKKIYAVRVVPRTRITYQAIDVEAL